MRLFLFYAGLLLVIYAGLFGLVIFKSMRPGVDRMDIYAYIDLLTYVGLPAMLILIFGGGSISVLQRRWLQKDTSISRFLWIPAILCLLASAWPVYKACVFLAQAMFGPFS